MDGIGGRVLDQKREQGGDGMEEEGEDDGGE